MRAAIGKYIVTGLMDDASDATGAFLEQIEQSPTLPKEALLDPNDFRSERLRAESSPRVFTDACTFTCNLNPSLLPLI